MPPLRSGQRVTLWTLDGSGAMDAVYVFSGAWPPMRWTWAVAGVAAMVAILSCHQLRKGPAPAGPAVPRQSFASPGHGVGIDPQALGPMMRRLEPLHRRMGPIQLGDWLASHREAGETFAQYLAAEPVRPDAVRRVIYLLPIGALGATQQKIVRLTADLVARYFCLPTKILAPLPLEVIPERARRTHPQWGMRQLLTSYILERVLEPRLPSDAVALLGLTAEDLWPGAGWNFVFGQASLQDRVGVWSIFRNGDPDQGPAAFRLCLMRTLKTATHELGHMFSMQHCTKYECNMCGSNNREEADRRPITLCPECWAKVAWANRCDPVRRYRELEQFFRDQSLVYEAEAYARLLGAIRGAR